MRTENKKTTQLMMLIDTEQTSVYSRHCEQCLFYTYMHCKNWVFWPNCIYCLTTFIYINVL